MSNLNRFDVATKRLSRAIGDLEGNVRKTVQDRGEGPGLKPEIEALTAERDRLQAEIAVLQERGKRLENAHQEAANRLDVAIDSIKTVLGRC